MALELWLYQMSSLPREYLAISETVRLWYVGLGPLTSRDAEDAHTHPARHI